MTDLTRSAQTRFFFSAGEPSGDLHAAGLIHELKRLVPGAVFRGLGGPNMEQAGCQVDVPLTKLAVMGLARVLWNIRTFRRWLQKVDDIIRNDRPDAVILVDFPGFNWHVARKAHAAGIPVFYFMPPQIWAWAQWRVRKMKRLVDHVLCCLDFERKWFEQHGCDVQLIGHPFLEETRKRQLDEKFLDSMTGQIDGAPVLTILPGSRDQEVAANLSDMIQTANLLQQKLPRLRPLIAAFKESQAEMIRSKLERLKTNIPVFVGRTPELMKLAHCCMAVSGSVSMELLAMTKPTVIYYRVGRIPLFVSRFFRRVKFITLTNLIAVDRMQGESIFYDDRTWLIPANLTEHEKELPLFPEFLTSVNRSREAAQCLEKWLTCPEILEEKRRNLNLLLTSTDVGNEPLVEAATYIVSALKCSEKMVQKNEK